MRRAAVAVCGYVALRVAIAAWIGPTVHPDTTGYRDYSVSITGSAPRPWVVSFLMQALGDWGFVLLQALVGGVAFAVLAIALVSQVTDRRVKGGVAVLVLLLGLAPRVTSWDAMLLSESLAISLTALLIAGLIWLERVPWPAVAALFAVWVFTRDAHLYLGAMLLVGIVVWGWRSREWVLPAVMAATMLWAGLAYRNDDTVEAWNVTMNVAFYAGTDVDTYRWFIDRGMPAHDAYMITDFDERFWELWHDPEFKEWAGSDGQTLYGRYLATHPGFVLDGFRYLFAESASGESLVDHSDQDIPETVGPGFVWPENASLYSLALATVAILAGLAVYLRGQIDKHWLLPGLLLVSTIPHALLAFHAAPADLARHGTILAFVLVVSCWWMIALAADRVVLKRSDVEDGVGQGHGYQPSVVAADSSVPQSPSERFPAKIAT